MSRHALFNIVHIFLGQRVVAGRRTAARACKLKTSKGWVLRPQGREIPDRRARERLRKYEWPTRINKDQSSREWTCDVQICVKTFATDGIPRYHPIPYLYIFRHSLEVQTFTIDRGPPTLAMSIGSRSFCPLEKWYPQQQLQGSVPLASPIRIFEGKGVKGVKGVEAPMGSEITVRSHWDHSSQDSKIVNIVKDSEARNPWPVLTHLGQACTSYNFW